MIEPGDHHPEYVEGASPGEWLALCPTSTGYELKTVTVRIEVFYGLCDSEDTEGRRVEADGCPDALILLRWPSLEPGPVATVAVGRFPVPKDFVAYLRLGPTSYAMHGVHKGYGEPALVYLAHDSNEQLIAELQCCSDNWPAILWAGDLDRDGKLDLLMSLATHYAGGDEALFLSSEATGKDLVREVARFSSSGCC